MHAHVLRELLQYQEEKAKTPEGPIRSEAVVWGNIWPPTDGFHDLALTSNCTLISNKKKWSKIVYNISNNYASILSLFSLKLSFRNKYNIMTLIKICSTQITFITISFRVYSTDISCSHCSVWMNIHTPTLVNVQTKVEELEGAAGKIFCDKFNRPGLAPSEFAF